MLAYSGDTGAGGSWADLVEDADLLLCEATYQGEAGNHDYPYHLTATEAGAIARARRARRLVLTHIPPHLDVEVSVSEAERAFDRPVGLAVPGTTYPI